MSQGFDSQTPAAEWIPRCKMRWLRIVRDHEDRILWPVPRRSLALALTLLSANPPVPD